MLELRFEWDAEKADENTRKYSVSFEEAQSIFSDQSATIIDDPDHSGDEDRFLLLGLSVKLRTVVVAHCYREGDEVIRIISARKATRSERDFYNGRWRK